MYQFYAWVYSQSSFQRPDDHEDKILLDMLIFNGKNMYNVDRKAKTMSQKNDQQFLQSQITKC